METDTRRPPNSRRWLALLILCLAAVTSFGHLRQMGMSQVDEMIYAVWGRETCDKWAWRLAGGDEADFQQMLSRHGGSFYGGNWCKPLQHIALVVTGSLVEDIATGTRYWQASFRLFVVLALLRWGSGLWGWRAAYLAAFFFSLNVESAAIWRLGMAHGQSSGLIALSAVGYLCCLQRQKVCPTHWFLVGCGLMAAVLTHMNTIPAVGVLLFFELWRVCRLGWQQAGTGARNIALGMLTLYLVSEVWHLLPVLFLPTDTIEAFSIRKEIGSSTLGQWLAMNDIATTWAEKPFAQRFYMYLIVPVFAEGVPMVCLALLGLSIFREKRSWEPRLLLPAVLLLLPLVYYLFYPRNNLELRNLAAGFPFFSLWAGIGAERVLRRRRIWVGGVWIVLACAFSVWQLYGVLELRSGQPEVAKRLLTEGIRRAYTNMWKPPEKLSALGYYGVSVSNLAQLPQQLPADQALVLYRKEFSPEGNQALQELMTRQQHWRMPMEVPPKYLEYHAMQRIPESLLPGRLREIRKMVIEEYEKREVIVFCGPLELGEPFRTLLDDQR